MASITCALRRIKDDLASLLSPSFIERICREVGHDWRERVLDPVTVIHLFILQILRGNVACAHVPRIAGREFTASAYCQARRRLPLKLITTLVSRLGVALQASTKADGLWQGHRVVLIDGSSFSMPDTRSLQKHFGQSGAQKKGCGFPTAHMMPVFDARSGLILGIVASPCGPTIWPGCARFIPRCVPATCWWAIGPSARSCIWPCCSSRECRAVFACIRSKL